MWVRSRLPAAGLLGRRCRGGHWCSILLWARTSGLSKVHIAIRAEKRAKNLGGARGILKIVWVGPSSAPAKTGWK